MLRVADIVKESIVDGPGIRYVIFAQGCKHGCVGCFNPQTQPFLGGREIEIEEIVLDIEKNPILKGITLSGGDPFEQAEEFARLAEKVKAMGKDVWAYTGYTYEEIIDACDRRKGFKRLLDTLDVLVDGRFEEEKKDLMLLFRGSSNQRVIDVQRTMKEGVITLARSGCR